jgi:hypothetical protein
MAERYGKLISCGLPQKNSACQMGDECDSDFSPLYFRIRGDHSFLGDHVIASVRIPARRKTATDGVAPVVMIVRVGFAPARHGKE